MSFDAKLGNIAYFCKKHIPLKKSTLIILALLAVACAKDPVEEKKPSKRTGTEYKLASIDDMTTLGDRLLPGDIVTLADGDYRDVSITLHYKGYKDNPVTFRAATPGKVILRGNSKLNIDGEYIVVSGLLFKDRKEPKGAYAVKFGEESKGCVLSDCMVDGTGLTPNAEINTKWVYIYGRENEVSNCSFIDKRSFGVLLEVYPQGTPENHKILRNRFTRPYTYFVENSASAMNGQEVIRIGTSSCCGNDSGTLVKGNYFYMCYGERGEIISNKSCKNTYTGNYFSACMGTLTLRHGLNCIVNGNYFTGPDGTETEDNKRAGGIRIIGSGHSVFDNYMEGLTGTGLNCGMCIMRGDSQEYDAEGKFRAGYQQVFKCSITNNTFKNCTQAILMNQGGGSGEGVNDVPPFNLTISGNTIVAKTSSQETVKLYETFDLSKITWDNNAIFGGKQTNASFETTSQEPYIKSREAEMKAIVDASGVRW